MKYARGHARARHGVLEMIEKTWLERYEAQLLQAHEKRVRLRKGARAAREARHKLLALKRHKDAQERARERELRGQPCGAKTRTGRPCQAKGLGRGRRCRYHGGLSTGPRTPEGRARIAVAQRRRWERWHAAIESSGLAERSNG